MRVPPLSARRRPAWGFDPPSTAGDVASRLDTALAPTCHPHRASLQLQPLFADDARTVHTAILPVLPACLPAWPPLESDAAGKERIITVFLSAMRWPPPAVPFRMRRINAADRTAIANHTDECNAFLHFICRRTKGKAESAVTEM